MVFTVAALVAAMMVSGGPAQANETNFENSTNLVCGEDFCFGGGDIGDSDNDFDGVLGIGDSDGVLGIGDFGSDVFGGGDLDSSLSVFCPSGSCNVDEIHFPDTDFSA